MNEVVLMFEGYSAKMKKLNKKLYKQFMEEFGEKYGEYFYGLLEQINTVDNKESMATIEAQNFVKEIFDLFEKNGKVGRTKKIDISIYVIYYVFPTILETKHANAKLLCDKIRDEWNSKFDQHIDYADYETIRDGFSDKLFGLF